MDKRKVIYYEDEMSDEFSKAKITPKKIDKDYVYEYSSGLKKFAHFFWYRVVATPLAYLYVKCAFHQKTVHSELFKPFSEQGYFLYGNHTQDIGDACIPHLLNFPKENYTIVHPNNVSMPFLGRITPSLGAIPLPDDRTAYKNFISCIGHRIEQGKAVVIYPEAHIWPYYTKIRPFPDTSFTYPVKWNAPVFCFTNTYQKRKFGKKPKIVTYIDGPFYPDETLPLRERRKELRNRVYDTMVKRSASSDMIQIHYVKKEQSNG